jgi:hypothetical protein
MSYFGAGVGQRPQQAPAEKPEEQPPKNHPQQCGQEEKDPPVPTRSAYFAVQLGNRPDKIEKGDKDSEILYLKSLSLSCPLCRGELAEVREGLHQCQGRCRARWLEESPGQLVDVAVLPLGICVCCERPHALVPGGCGALCPVSGQEYVLLPSGPVLLATAAPEGLCLCCVPPMPLVRQGDTLACQAKPNHHYQRDGSGVILISTPEVTSAEMVAAIDTALRRNSASLTINGLFDFE